MIVVFAKFQPFYHMVVRGRLKLAEGLRRWKSRQTRSRIDNPAHREIRSAAAHDSFMDIGGLNPIIKSGI